MSLRRTVERHETTLYSVGYALTTIGNLLGANGSEHHLDDADMNGLQHAVIALGSLVTSIAVDIAVAIEKLDSAPRNAIVPNRGAEKEASNE